MHRVTPVEGGITRILMVLAYTSAPGVSLSESARMNVFWAAVVIRPEALVHGSELKTPSQGFRVTMNLDQEPCTNASERTG